MAQRAYPSYEEIHEMLQNPARKAELDQLMEDYGLKDLPSPFEVFDRSESLSYGVRCAVCGEPETACTCEVDA